MEKVETVETVETVTKVLEVKLPPLHLACSSDDLRPNGSLIEIRNNIATATNFHSIVKLDLTICTSFTPNMLKILEGKFIHKEVWSEFHKCDELEIDDLYIYVVKDGVRRFFEYSNSQGEFFNIDSIIIQIKEAGEEAKRHICHNPKTISMIAKVFGSDSLNFSFSKDHNGTVLFPSQDSGMCAILMPMLSENTNRYLFY